MYKIIQQHSPLGLPGSGAAGSPLAQMSWFGQPWHADCLPANSLCVPGHSAKQKQDGWLFDDNLIYTTAFQKAFCAAFFFLSVYS